ncbi:hypothetical protein ACFOW4_23460 [Micromonospora sp. GCM10011542]|uniref:hypothetical protein n=1 Tax=Micromonospora sp. GCM10011542 TaxID=3317337 RepID=UPI00361490CA
MQQIPVRRRLSLSAALLAVTLSGCSDGTPDEGARWTGGVPVTPTAAYHLDGLHRRRRWRGTRGGRRFRDRGGRGPGGQG